MREWKAEFIKTYETYSFGYCSYAQYEPGDELTNLYAYGYLPFSGSPDAQSVFYMARSARVPLSNYTFTSENRRIAKMYDDQFIRTERSPHDFAVDEDAVAFCLDYFSIVHDARIMPRERLLHILADPVCTHVITYKNVDDPVGHVLVARDVTMEHFWFSAFAPAYLKKNLGMWLMLDCVREAQKSGHSHYYLGTVYGEKALYKANFEPLEWWDGSAWLCNPHNQELRTRAKDDTHGVQLDTWQQSLRRF